MKSYNKSDSAKAKVSATDAKAERQSWLLAGGSLLSAIGMVKSQSTLVSNQRKSLIKTTPFGSYSRAGGRAPSPSRLTADEKQAPELKQTGRRNTEPSRVNHEIKSADHRAPARVSDKRPVDKNIAQIQATKANLNKRLAELRAQYQSGMRKQARIKAHNAQETSGEMPGSRVPGQKTPSLAPFSQVRKSKLASQSAETRKASVSAKDSKFVSLSQSIHSQNVSSSQSQIADPFVSVSSNSSDTSEEEVHRTQAKRLSQENNRIINHRAFLFAKKQNSASVAKSVEDQRASLIASSEALSEASALNPTHYSAVASNTIIGNAYNPNYVVTFRNYSDNSKIAGPFDFGFLRGYKYIKLGKALEMQPKIGTAKHPRGFKTNFHSLIPSNWLPDYYWHNDKGDRTDPDKVLSGSVNDYTTSFDKLPHFTLWFKSRPVAPIQISYYFYGNLKRNQIYTPKLNDYGKVFNVTDLASVPKHYTISSTEPATITIGSKRQRAKVNFITKLVPQQVAVHRIKENIGGKNVIGRFTDVTDSSPHTPNKRVEYYGTSYAPQGYIIDSNHTKDVKAKIGNGANTVKPKEITFYYKPIEISIPIYFVDHGNHQIGSGMIHGANTEQITTGEAGKRAGVPKGYRIDPNQNNINVFRVNDIRPIRVYVQGHPYVRHFTVHRIEERQNGDMFNAGDKVVSIKGYYGESSIKTLGPAEFEPEGYKIDIDNPNNVNHHPKLSNKGILIPNTATYYYRVMRTNEPKSPVKPIQVTYRNQNGNDIGHSIVQGYMNQTKTVSQIGSDANNGAIVPEGYTVDRNQNRHVKFDLQRHPIIVKVTGKRAERKLTIKRYRSTPNGLSDNDQPITVNFISHVGDKTTFHASDYEPVGYRPDRRRVSTIDLVVNPDQTVSSSGNSFFYRPVFSDEKNSPIKPVQINYVEDQSRQILESILVHGYTNERINLASLDSVPKGYDIVPGQDYYHKFSVTPTQPVNLTVEPTLHSSSDVMAPTSDVEPKMRSDFIFKGNRPTHHPRTISLTSKCKLDPNKSRYVIAKRPLEIHSSIIFDNNNRFVTIKPENRMTFYILGKYKYEYRNNKYYCYMIKFFGRIGYILDDPKLIEPAYYTRSEYSRFVANHSRIYIKIIGNGCYVYDDNHLYRSARQKFYRPGRKIRVYGMVGINRARNSKHFGMTRFVISHNVLGIGGDKYITGNKNNVRLL